MEALEKELGGLKHAVISGPAIAVPHNSAMLRLERDLYEGMSNEPRGLVQLFDPYTRARLEPAGAFGLAGDKRADASGKGIPESP